MRSGVSTATPAPREPTQAPVSTSTPAGTPAPASTRTPAPPPEADPTEIEVALAELGGEDARLIAGALEVLSEQCSDDREALGEFAERTWRALNEQRGIRAPVTAIVGRVIASLPIDGRAVACESLFASVVTELARQ